MDVWVGEDVPGILIHDIPASGLEGKFSMRYCLAVALAKGEVALESFTDEAVHEPSMLALLRRIRVDTDSTLPRIATGVTHQARVRVSTRRGDQLQREEAVPIGSPELPCSSAQLAAKLRSCVSFGLGSERARRACNAIETLKRSDPLSRILDAVHPDGL